MHGEAMMQLISMGAQDRYLTLTCHECPYTLNKTQIELLFKYQNCPPSLLLEIYRYAKTSKCKCLKIKKKIKLARLTKRLNEKYFPKNYLIKDIEDLIFDYYV